MLKKKVESVSKIDTLIGKNTKLSGKVEAMGTIRIDGELDGDLIIDGNIIIGTDGKITGNITGNSIFVSGTIRGNVFCKEQLRLANTAKLFGDTEVKTLIIDENAIFEGKCKMENISTSTINDSTKIKELNKSNA